MPSAARATLEPGPPQCAVGIFLLIANFRGTLSVFGEFPPFATVRCRVDIMNTPVCRVAHALRENESDQAALHVLVFWHTERVPHTHQRLLCNHGRAYDEAPPHPLKNVVRYGGLDKAAATLKATLKIGRRYAVRPRGYSRWRTYFRGKSDRQAEQHDI